MWKASDLCSRLGRPCRTVARLKCPEGRGPDPFFCWLHPRAPLQEFHLRKFYWWRKAEVDAHVGGPFSNVNWVPLMPWIQLCPASSCILLSSQFPCVLASSTLAYSLTASMSKTCNRTCLANWLRQVAKASFFRGRNGKEMFIELICKCHISTVFKSSVASVPSV